MSASHRPEGFVQLAWASPTSQNLWRQDVIVETLSLTASEPIDPALAESEKPEDEDGVDAENHSAHGDVDTLKNSATSHSDERLEQVREEAYAKGVEESRERIRAELMDELNELKTHDQAMIRSLESALETLKISPLPFFEPMKRLALHLAEQLVLGELSLDATAIDRLVQRCIDDLSSQNESLILVELNPDDLILLEALRARGGQGGGLNLRFQPDPDLLPGSVRASANDAIVEDLIEHRLEAFARDLYIKEAQWKLNAGFDPERLARERVSRSKGVDDARPRMSAATPHDVSSVIDELIEESDNDV